MNDTIETRWEQQNEAGRLAFTDGDYVRAEQSFLAAIREATQLGADNVRLASSLSNLGQLKYKQKDFAQAEALFHRALAIRERVLGPEHFGLVQNINNLAALHYARGELDQAEPLFQRALGISQQHLGEGHPDVAVTLNNLARLYFRKNEYASAGPLLARLLTIKEQALGASHPEIAAILTSLAKVRLHMEDYDGGEEFARRALEIREKLQLPNDLAVATALETLAEINAARGRMGEELRHRERALAVREGAMGPDHPVVVAARAALQARRAVAEGEMPPVMAPPPRAMKPPQAPPPAAPPVVKSPVVAPPSIIISPPPARAARSSSLPWIEVTEAPPTFDRVRPSGAPQTIGSNAAVAIPVRNAGNGARSAAIDSRTMESPLAFHPALRETGGESCSANDRRECAGGGNRRRSCPQCEWRELVHEFVCASGRRYSFGSHPDRSRVTGTHDASDFGSASGDKPRLADRSALAMAENRHRTRDAGGDRRWMALLLAQGEAGNIGSRSDGEREVVRRRTNGYSRGEAPGGARRPTGECREARRRQRDHPFLESRGFAWEDCRQRREKRVSGSCFRDNRASSRRFGYAGSAPGALCREERRGYGVSDQGAEAAIDQG